MSSFVTTAINRETGEKTQVWAIDDYFGPHAYGYQFLTGTVLTEEEFNRKYRSIHDEHTR